jgi:hypothetical protein
MQKVKTKTIEEEIDEKAKDEFFDSEDLSLLYDQVRASRIEHCQIGSLFEELVKVSREKVEEIINER